MIHVIPCTRTRSRSAPKLRRTRGRIALVAPRRAAERQYRHLTPRRRRRGRPVFVAIAALLALTVIAGSVWLIKTVGSDRSSAAGRPHGQQTSPTAGSSVAAVIGHCREQVDQAEAVLKAGRTGIEHWNQHVQAQTDVLAGRISQQDFETTIKDTRDLGPRDLSRWDDALGRWKDDPQACSGVNGATPEDAAALGKCGRRLNALRTALPSAKAAIEDWRKLQSAMSREDELGSKNKDWLAIWKKAPANITAWESADAALDDAPACPE